jgi:hypothetical protein
LGKLAVLVAATALVLAPASALAKKKHKKKPINLGPVVSVTATGNEVSSSAQESTATATCPAGLQAVGGGFTAPPGPGNAIVVHESYMSSPTSWTVSGHHEGGTGAVTSTVNCRNTSRAPVGDVGSTIDVTGIGALGTAAPTCPGTSQAIAGGFQSPVGPGNDVLIPKTSLATSANTWTVTALNLESGGTFSLTAHTYCMNGIRAPTVVTKENSTAAVQYTTVTAETQACPVLPPPKKKKTKKGKKKRKKVIQPLLSAGGFSSPVTPGATPVGVIGVSQIGTSAGWFSSAINATNGTGTLSLTTQGICV